MCQVSSKLSQDSPAVAGIKLCFMESLVTVAASPVFYLETNGFNAISVFQAYELNEVIVFSIRIVMKFALWHAHPI